MATQLKMVQLLDLIAAGKIRRMTNDEELTYMCEGTGYVGHDEAGHEVMLDVGEEDEDLFGCGLAISAAVLNTTTGEQESALMVTWAKP